MTPAKTDQHAFLIINSNPSLAERIVALYGAVYWYNPTTMRFVHLSLVESDATPMLQSQELDLSTFLKDAWLKGTALNMVSAQQGKALTALGHWANAALLRQSHRTLQHWEAPRSPYKTSLRQLYHRLEEEVQQIVQAHPVTEQQLRAVICHRATSHQETRVC
jgi:hypothetical protein